MLAKDSTYNANLNLGGIKIAYVVSNEDPKGQERVLVRVLGVHNLKNTSIDNGVWANHCSPFRDASGDLPEPGDYVYVTFPNRADPMTIIWLGYVRSSKGLDGDDGTEINTKPQHSEVTMPGLDE